MLLLARGNRKLASGHASLACRMVLCVNKTILLANKIILFAYDTGPTANKAKDHANLHPSQAKKTLP
jgi:hypothetical protein